MAALLIYTAKAPEAEEVANRFGGLPLVPRGASIPWPACKSCGGAMQFLGQLVIPYSDRDGEYLMLLFMCQNKPGMCDDWDANLGGNRAIAAQITNEMIILESPGGERTLRESVYGANAQAFDVDGYEAARQAWVANTNSDARKVLGQLLGEPSWIQADETPNCDSCTKPMRFVAQLEEGPDRTTNMNFGGGCAYVFDCDCHSAKLLWQQ